MTPVTYREDSYTQFQRTRDGTHVCTVQSSLGLRCVVYYRALSRESLQESVQYRIRIIPHVIVSLQHITDS